MNEHNISWQQSKEQQVQTEDNDVRTRTTRSIWGMMLPMLGICIPLCAVTQTGALIPIAVLASAAISTAAVWLRGNAVNPLQLAKEAAMQKQIRELEERLGSLESITNFEHRLLEAKYPGVVPSSATQNYTESKAASELAAPQSE